MAQFDIFANPSRNARSTYPYVITLQSDVSAGSRTAIVAPVAQRHKADVDDRAIIPITIDGAPYSINLHAVSAIPAASLGTVVATSPEVRERLPRALDYLFLGI